MEQLIECKNKIIVGEIKFSTFCQFLNKIDELKGEKKIQLIQIYNNRYIELNFEKYFLKDDRDNSFKIIRLLLPQYDRERPNFKLKEKNLARLISKALNLPQKDQLRLINFMDPTKQPAGSQFGEFGTVLQDVLSPVLRQQSQLSLDQFNDFLDQLGTDNRINITAKILSQISSQDIKWFGRIILKDLKIGVKHSKILQIYHQDALKYFNLNQNLKLVCEKLICKHELLENSIQLFEPIRGMLASRRNLEQIKKIFNKISFFIENKYDGERVQCHFDYRNGFDVSNIYGPKLNQAQQQEILKQVKLQSAILDGEIIIVHKKTNKMQPFGKNKTVAKASETDYRPCYMIFDILYGQACNGKKIEFMDKPLTLRKQFLLQNISNKKGFIEIVNGKETSDLSLIESEFQQCQSNELEGIIIKQSQSKYIPNDRSDFWVKMKADYYDGILDTLDLLVIGGYFIKQNKVQINQSWTSYIHMFLLGIMVKCDQNHPKQCIIRPFCRVGTGLSQNELKILKQSNKYKFYNFIFVKEIIVTNKKNSF